MEINDLTVNDDLVTVVRKCNVNFKNLAYTFSRSIKDQSRMDVGSLDKAIQELSGRIADITNNTIPKEVAKQIEALDLATRIHDEAKAIMDYVPTEVRMQIDALDIPAMVAAASVPAVGTYIIADEIPAYEGTEWVQAGSLQLAEGEDPVPIWKRTV